MSSPWLWYVSRSGGVVTMVLLTTVVVLGIVTSVRPNPHHAGPAIAMGLHRTLALGSTIFLITHIGTALIDTYVPIGWVSAVVPFTSSYHRTWVGLGSIAFDLFAAVIVTSLLRHRLPTRLWRLVHWFTYAMAPIAVVHGLMMATWSQPVLLAITAGCGAVMIETVAWRLLRPDPAARRRADILAQEWI
ncbi:MAG: ferric reductase-like transmembrane domain-containing protein [Nocardia sp.]|nr:ferric reductase-like transmembrane domain-containing protein [Nocardia sp.]